MTTAYLQEVLVYYGFFDTTHCQIASGMKKMRFCDIPEWLDNNPGTMITKIR